MRCSIFSSKFLRLPPFQIMKLPGVWFVAVSSPTSIPFSTRQMLGLASHPFKVLPSNMDLKPASLLAGTSGTIVFFAGPPWAACNAVDNAMVLQQTKVNVLITCLLGNRCRKFAGQARKPHDVPLG